MDNSNLILATDESEYTTEPLKKHLQRAGYNVITANDGESCLKIALENKPRLIILDLTLPKLHGIEILKTLKINPETKQIGVIITSGRGLYQDYQTSMENGADYFLIKPLDFHWVVKLVQQFFLGELKANTFPGTSHLLLGKQEGYYDPQPKHYKSYLRLWGTRGSITVSGVEYHRFGGSTSCLELRYEDQVIIIDAGTGIRALGKELMKETNRQFHLLIGHTHWDHIIGFPFFEPAYHKDFKIDFYGAKGFGKSLKDLFMGMLDRDYFPIRLSEMQASIVFHEIHDDIPLKMGKISIACTYANHPGATLCFKIILPKKTIGYVTDNEFLIGFHGSPSSIHEDDPRINPYRNFIHFFKDCDLLIHEAQYTPHQYRKKVGWGHSSIANVAVLIKFAGIKNWLITHHDPEDNDDLLWQKLQLTKQILQESNIDCNVDLAYDGMLLPINDD